MVSIDTHNKVDVTMRPPFAQQAVRGVVPANSRLFDIICGAVPAGVKLKYVHAYIGDHKIHRQHWHRVRVKEGQSVRIAVVPMGGGGGKNPLSAVLTLALTVAAPGIGTALASGLGLGWTAGGTFIASNFFGVSSATILGGVVTMAGKLAISAIAPPSRQKSQGAQGVTDKPTLFIEGARNELRPFGRVPKAMGRHRMVPPLAVPPYTETIGNQQYVRMLFCWGYGVLRISDIRIGDTALENFTDYEIETREGWPDDDPITLYSNTVVQNNLSIGLTKAGGYQTRTTESDADEISVDITFPRGLTEFNASGTKKTRTVQLAVEYAPTGTEDWSIGVESYRSLSSAVSDAMPRPSRRYFRGVTHKTAIPYRVVMNASNGSLKVLEGERYYVDAIPFITQQPGEPVFPAVPAGYIKIARVIRKDDDPAQIPAGSIVDERDPALFGDVIEDSGDFVASTSGQDDKITIGSGGLKFKGIFVTGKQTSALRRSYRFTVPRGQYDVRVKRITGATTDDKIVDETVWTALRTHRNESPVAMTGLALTAIRIKATDQLNGVIDRLNAVVESVLPDWDSETETWIERETTNPASIFRAILQGAENARPLTDDRIDLSALAEWHEDCDAAARQFNYVFDGDISVNDALRDVAAAGRASAAIIDGKWKVVQDKEKTVPVQHFTPRNSSNFEAVKNFPDLPHAFKISFINAAKDWTADEIVVPDDGYTAETATKFEALQFNGITNAEQAYKDGRYHIATARLRPETYSITVGVENIVCTRGDLVRLTHDVMLVGLAVGRIKSVTTDSGDVTGVVIDEKVVMEAGKSYAVQIRTADGAMLSEGVQTVLGEQSSLLFATPFTDEGSLKAGNLLAFGETGAESLDCIVKGIEPQGDLTAKLTLVPAAPAVHTADQGSLPSFDTAITIPIDMKRPPAPVVVNTQTNEDVMIRSDDGTYQTVVSVTLAPHGFALPLTTEVKIKAADETDFYPAKFIKSEDVLTILDVEGGEIYDIKILYKTGTGLLSAETVISGLYVVGATGIPSDVENFGCNIQGQQAHLSWDAVPDIDISHYRIKYANVSSGAAWSSSVDLVSKVSAPQTSITVPALTGTYMIKAVDYGGRESSAAGVVVSNIADLAGYNAVASVTESPDFSGTAENIDVLSGAIQLAGQSNMDDWEDLDAIENFDYGDDGLHATGTYTFANSIDLGAVYTSRVLADIEVAGINLLDNFDTIENLDLVEDLDTVVDPSAYDVRLQIRTTNDDPSGAPTWTSWQNLIVGDYTARAFEFRAVLIGKESGITPYITGLSVTVDMPDRIEAQHDLTSDAAGATVDFTHAFKAVPAVAVTGNDMDTGDYFTVSSVTETGFDIRFFNASGTGVVRQFDYVAKGFGKV